MPRLVLLAVALALAVGCGKNKPAADTGTGGTEHGKPGPAAAGDAYKADREKLVGNLRGGKNETRQAALDALADWQDDAELIAALLDLLKDKTATARPFPGQVNSAREAAAIALTRVGPRGETALKERGLNVLRDGLADPSAAVRESTIAALAQLGPRAQPVAGAIQKLCVDPDPKVRGAAFDALRSTGGVDGAALAGLLTNADPEIRRFAAELIGVQTEMPPAAVAPLVKALEDEDDFIRAAAAEGLALVGPAAGAEAAKKLAEAIRREYPMEAPPTGTHPPAAMSYWKALGRIGKAAVEPVGELVKHTNWLVRAVAVRVLGESGTLAKGELPRIRDALGDPFAGVALEAAVAVCRLGDDAAPAVRVVTSALGSTNEQVAAVAIATVPRLGPAGKALIPTVLARLADPSPLCRFAAADFVRLLDPADAEQAVPELAKRAADPVPEVRLKVGEVLEALGPRGGPAAEAVGKALPGEKEAIVRDQFVLALAAMGAAARPATAGLLPILGDATAPVLVRAKVADTVAVADPGSTPVAAALIRLAGDADPTLRVAAAGALGKLDPVPAALVKLAREDSRTEVRMAALRALAAAGPRASSAKGDLTALAADPTPSRALWAKVALAAIDGDAAKAAPAVRAALADKSAVMRTTAAEALLLAGGPTPADLPALSRLLRESSDSAKAAAARAIGPLGPAAKEAVPRLAELLADKSGGVRIAAAEALGQMGPTALPAAARLRALATDPLAGRAAVKALGKIDTAAAPK